MELFIIVIIAMNLVIMTHSLLTGRLLGFIIVFSCLSLPSSIHSQRTMRQASSVKRQAMKAIIILICIFTPPLGWILLVYLMHQWQREEALEKFIETGDRSDLKIKEGGSGEAIGDGILTGVLIILMVAGGLFLLVAAADAHDHIARWECDQRNCAVR